MVYVMQELAVLLGSMAGAGAAVVMRWFPRGDGTRLQRVGAGGAGGRIREQAGALGVERDILNKTIARLYEGGGGGELSAAQRDRLLLKYQHQLGVVLAKIDRLEAAQKHPDLGPVGDGLITLMDQKLSGLDNRLYELSAKISTSGLQAGGGDKKEKDGKKVADAVAVAEPQRRVGEEAAVETGAAVAKAVPAAVAAAAVAEPSVTEKAGGGGGGVQIPAVGAGPKHPVEITTLTTIPRRMTAGYPFDDRLSEGGAAQPGQAGGDVAPKPEEGGTGGMAPAVTRGGDDDVAAIRDGRDEDAKLPEPRRVPAPGGEGEDATGAAVGGHGDIGISDDDDDDDGDDLERIKGNILKTLSKLEQAEV